MGSSVRVVAYYSNFVLISAFFGLGAGALTVRFDHKLWKYLFVVLAVCVVGSPFFGIMFDSNPPGEGEYVWLGGPQGVDSPVAGQALAPYWIILAVVYLINSFLFLIFGQWLGHLFQSLPPLKAYTVEIAGSILGILLFAAVSFLWLPPPLWFLMGLVQIWLIFDRRVQSMPLAVVCSLAVLGGSHHYSRQFRWSPYYKIQISRFDHITDGQGRVIFQAQQPMGYKLSVNNDYHQMMVDLRESRQDHDFFASWRWLYDYPYVSKGVEGPILIVGAGTGNDVSAALRRTQAHVDAVEIDPMINRLGRRLHFEQPYSNPRVSVVINDARSYFARTDQRYSKVVFGFLDSHTLMSSYASVRLDNFVYTRQSLERVKDILLPGGEVYLTFASNTQWLNRRLIKLLDSVFDFPTEIALEKQYQFANGVVYRNRKAREGEMPAPASRLSDVLIPTDDWPYLYMKEKVIPDHYLVFMFTVMALGAASLGLLPAGQRRLRLPYFFMGAGFFLLETHNVISLSLLYGSTWVVNVVVFVGVLILVLLGNLTCMRVQRPRFNLIFALLFLNLAVSYVLTASDFLRIEWPWLRGVLAVPVFLGPIYFASLVFGHLIKQEESLAQAYGSNLLGAVVGGSMEYFSLMMGIKFLVLLTVAFYVLAWLFLRRDTAMECAA